MGKRLASAKSDLKRLAAENGNITSEFSKKVAEQQNEMRSMKELNARLSEDNQELRDLCCFLDDDRQKGRKLAREWQRFGRYTASVMRQEVSNYQSKLKELAGKQEDLIRDNLELKVKLTFLLSGVGKKSFWVFEKIGEACLQMRYMARGAMLASAWWLELSSRLHVMPGCPAHCSPAHMSPTDPLLPPGLSAPCRPLVVAWRLGKRLI